MNTFKKDVEASKLEENKLQADLESLGYSVTGTTTEDYQPDWDLRVQHPTTKKITTIEHKYDIKATQTGNTCIELYKDVNGKQEPSGLSASKSDWWIYTFENDNHYYMVKPSTIQQKIDSKEYTYTCWGGYQNKFQLAIINKEIFISWCTVIPKIKKTK